MVTRSAGVCLDQLEFDRKTDFKIKIADPRQQSIETGRGSCVGQAGAVGIRVEADARAPTDVQQERLGTDGRGVLGKAEHCLPIMVSERGGTGIEDDAVVVRRFVLQVPMRARRCCIKPVAPGPHDPRGVVGLTDAEHNLARLQELSATEIGPAVRRTLHPMLDSTTESNVHLPHLTAPEAGSCLCQS
jgi:hypothetical protein